jgi:carbamoyltransferase
MPDHWIIGINAYHGDASACLLHNGQLIAAAEEERFRRIKHWAGFPSESISYCLKEANIKLRQIHTLAINSDPSVNLLRKTWYALKNKPEPQLILNRLRNHRARFSIEKDLKVAFPNDTFKGNIKKVEHHLAHLASSFFSSSFEEALAVSVDGFGDFSSCSWGIGQGTRLKIQGKIYFPHSLGAFYQAMTQYLGFPHYGDEYKVMGLAPYGKPIYMDKMKEIIHLNQHGYFQLNLKYFRFHRENIDYTWKDGIPKVQAIYNHRFENLLGPPRESNEPLTERHFDIARSTQAMYETTFFHVLRQLHKQLPQKNIALSGGCAMNSVANGKIVEQTPFEQIYVPSAAGDAGGAIGAALMAWHQKTLIEKATRISIQHPYWGPGFDHSHIEDIIEKHIALLEQNYCQVEYIKNELELLECAAGAIIDGKVIGWFQGRMELGPRALGNRSILCDPRRKDMKDILNLKIKRRESFRPFAPVILREAVSEWFEYDADVPFMSQVLKIRPEKRKLIPAVTHVDGTGRLQTVKRETNPLYYDLIATFAKITGVPLLLNTSFNEQEPIVCKPEEALACFVKTNMDMLVMENWVISRKEIA